MIYTSRGREIQPDGITRDTTLWELIEHGVDMRVYFCGVRAYRKLNPDSSKDDKEIQWKDVESVDFQYERNAGKITNENVAIIRAICNRQ